MDIQSLPTDREQCRAAIAQNPKQMEELLWRLVEEVRRLFALSEKQKHMLEQMLRHRYGQRADRFDANQLMLAIFEALDAQAQEAAAQPPSAPADEQNEKKAPRKGHGRRPLPKDLPRQRVVHEPTEAEKICACCGKPKACIGEEVSEQLEYKPAEFLVIEHVRMKYVCKPCEEGVVLAEKPSQPIEKGLPAPGLLAHVAVSKYADHLPLHRLEGIFERLGLEISRKTMCDWMAACADILAPLYEKMKTEVLLSRIIHTDDTPVPVQDPERTKTREGRIWVYVGDADHPFTVFDYTPGRGRDGPADFLKGWKGFLQADAYKGYDHLYVGGDIVEVACMAHTRRYYVDSQSSDPMRAIMGGVWIHQLYEVEDKAKELSPTQRVALRQKEAVPILEKFKEWLLEQKPHVLPKSPIGEAIGYTLSNWEALNRYTEDGDLAIDNNRAERMLRAWAIGRGNWLFFGSDRGGRTAAILMSFIATCKDHRIDPFAYLRDVLARISDHPAKRLTELLPTQWKAAHA
jgi:transposase